MHIEICKTYSTKVCYVCIIIYTNENTLVRIISILNTAVQCKVECSHRNYSCSISSVKISLFPFYFLFLLATFFVISSPKRFMFEYRITCTIRFIHPMLGNKKYNYDNEDKGRKLKYPPELM